MSYVACLFLFNNNLQVIFIKSHLYSFVLIYIFFNICVCSTLVIIYLMYFINKLDWIVLDYLL